MVGFNGSAQKRASFSRLFVQNLVLWFSLCGTLFPSIASAQGEPGFPGGGGASVAKDVETDWIVRQLVEERLQTFGTDLLGDSIDPDTGGLVFSHTDVVLLGYFVK